MNVSRMAWWKRVIVGASLASLAFIPDSATAEPTITLLKNFVIRQSLRQSKSMNIFTVNDRLNYDRGVFRPPPKSLYKKSWRMSDLVFVAPGGLENAAYAQYSLAIQNEIPKPYDKGSFSFSGPAEALISIVGVGWGSQNNNGDFIPLLLSDSYEDKKVPHYSVIWEWERRTGFPGLGGRVYLDYLIKIPKRSQTQWGTELSFKRQNFAGSFSVNAPTIAADRVYRWRNFRFQTFKESLRLPPVPLSWKLPRQVKPNGFSVSSGANQLFMASDEGKISCWSLNGKKKWEAPGRAPVLAWGEKVLAPAGDYHSINVLDAESGEAISSVKLPEHLPRSGNSLCSFSCGDETFLLLIVPEQSNTLFFSIKD